MPSPPSSPPSSTPPFISRSMPCPPSFFVSSSLATPRPATPLRRPTSGPASPRLRRPPLLLASIQHEDTKSIAKKLCDTVSELAAGLLPDDSWPELLPFMFQSVTSNNPRLQESALLIFSQLAQYIGDTLRPHLPTLHPVLLSSLSHPTSADVRIAALSVAINLVQSITS